MLESFFHHETNVPLSQVNLIIGKANTGKSKFIQRIEGHCYKSDIHKVLFYDNPWTNLHHTNIAKIISNLFDVCVEQNAQAFIVSNDFDIFYHFLEVGSKSKITSRLLRFGHSVKTSDNGKVTVVTFDHTEFDIILETDTILTFR